MTEKHVIDTELYTLFNLQAGVIVMSL